MDNKMKKIKALKPALDIYAEFCKSTGYKESNNMGIVFSSLAGILQAQFEAVCRDMERVNECLQSGKKADIEKAKTLMYWSKIGYDKYFIKEGE